MKVIDTAIYTKKKASLPTIGIIIRELQSSGEIWLSLYDTQKNKPNYVQIHSQTSPEDENLCRANDALPLLPYLAMIEARVYDEKGSFRHYRYFSRDYTYVYSVFETCYTDQVFSYETWQDVTHEFENE